MSYPSDSLKLLCSEANKVKETYYGSIHRANFSINGEKGDWDILRISIPCAPMKEAEFMRRFHVSREDLPGFYAGFEKAVVRHSALIKDLNATGLDSIRKSFGIQVCQVSSASGPGRESDRAGLLLYHCTDGELCRHGAFQGAGCLPFRHQQPRGPASSDREGLQ